MNLLIDTQTLIWFLEGDKRISAKALTSVKNSANKIHVSIISFWEMAIKLSIKKLQLSQPLNKIINKTIDLQIGILQLEYDNILKVENLPFHHRDPFDRIIIATAITEQLPIISNDEKFDLYGVERVW